VWRGTADSVVDLHQYLTILGITFVDSIAYDVLSNGDVIGTAFDDTRAYAVLWILVPEPAASTLLWGGAVGIWGSRRCQRRRDSLRRKRKCRH